MPVDSVHVMGLVDPVSVGMQSAVGRPVFAFISTVLIVVAVLYGTGVLKSVPCGPGVLKGLNRTLIHANGAHIAANLFAFFVLSRIEAKYGSRFFAALLVQIAVAAAVIELTIHQFFHVPCAVGFSGILFGLTAWEMVNSRDVNFTLLLSLAAMTVAPSLESSKVSLIGHSIGTVAGLAVALYYKPDSARILGSP